MSGRGAYYKEKYGSGGRGKGKGGSGGYDGGGKGKGGGGFKGGGKGGRGGGDAAAGDAAGDPSEAAAGPRRCGTAAELRASLLAIDGRPYGAYHDVEGIEYDMGRFKLLIDKVQSDPFAPPSRCHVSVPIEAAGFAPDCFQPRVREVAFRDFLTRRFSAGARRAGADRRTEEGGWQGPKGGELLIDTPGQHVLERSAVVLERKGSQPQGIEARFCVALPARGRSIMGAWAAQILTETLPQVVHGALYAESCAAAELRRHLDSVEDQHAARAQLLGLDLVAFVGDGAVLPRRSGASDLPMDGPSTVRFASPPEMRVTMRLPHAGEVVGMGVRRGVSLIVGGGFHGKSTLLEALQLGVYDKLPGDGRELVVTEPSATKVRAEDGRCVTSCDISPFIANLPGGRDTSAFSSEDASGSTSQAAAIIEALEAGCSTLLIDEDTSATNFMIRDERMQRLVAAENEPIRPFISRVRTLWERHAVSTVMVVGGAGDYFDVADGVLMMDSYVPRDATARAKQVAAELPSLLPAAAPEAFATLLHRCPGASGLACDAKVAAARSSIRFGDLPELDLAAVEQIVEHSQVRAIGEALVHMAASMDGGTSVRELLGKLRAELDGPRGIDALHPRWRLGNLAMPREQEVAAALNRLRALQVKTTRRVPLGK